MVGRGSVLLFQVLFIILCCQIFSAFSQSAPFNWVVTVSVSGSTPTFNRTTPVNLPTGNLYITHNSTVLVCLKRAFEVPTDVNKWSSTNCDYFQVFNGTIPTPPTPPNPPAPEHVPSPSPQHVPEPTSEHTPEPTSEHTPEPTSEHTPEPTPEHVPEPTSEHTPEPTPEHTPEPTPEHTPEPHPEPTPEPTSEHTPEPAPETTPEPHPEPHPEPSSEPTPEPAPETTPEPAPLTLNSVIIINDVEEFIPVVFANDVYYIGVAFDPKVAPPPQVESVTIKINGTSCTGGYVWNGEDCIEPITTLPHEDNFPVGNSEHTSYLRLTVPEFTTRLQLSATVTDGSTQSIVGSFQSAPSVSNPQERFNLANTIEYPSVGDWQIEYSLTSTAAGAAYTLNSANIHSCPNASFIGESCNISVSGVNPVTPAPLVVKFIQKDNWDYYQVTTSTNPATFLWVSAAPSGGSLGDFHLYIRRGAPPQLNAYDYKDCLVPPCASSYAYTFALNNTQQNYTYYVGIYANQSTTYGIWWNSVCPPNCINNEDDSGECVWDGPNFGQCICDDGYTGLDCTENTGTLPTQYIVLIIIASLVVLSALIGFFAWAYMQRKREGYSSLS